MDEKENMRENVLARRDALDAETRARKSAAICHEIKLLIESCCAQRPSVENGANSNPSDRTDDVSIYPNSDRAPRIAVYAAMRSEVDLLPFVEDAFARGWDVCFPCMVRDKSDAKGRMTFYRVPRGRLDHARGAFLDHPLRCLPCAALAGEGYEEAEPASLDAVAVPLVAFDGAGNRLGYGGGNYDRLLPRLRSDALVVGVAFDEQRVDAVPCEPHDRPLPRIVHA